MTCSSTRTRTHTQLVLCIHYTYQHPHTHARARDRSDTIYGIGHLSCVRRRRWHAVCRMCIVHAITIDTPRTTTATTSSSCNRNLIEMSMTLRLAGSVASLVASRSAACTPAETGDPSHCQPHGSASSQQRVCGVCVRDRVSPFLRVCEVVRSKRELPYRWRVIRMLL